MAEKNLATQLIDLYREGADSDKIRDFMRDNREGLLQLPPGTLGDAVSIAEDEGVDLTSLANDYQNHVAKGNVLDETGLLGAGAGGKAIAGSTATFAGRTTASRTLESLRGGISEGGREFGQRSFAALEATAPSLLRSIGTSLNRLLFGSRGGALARVQAGTSIPRAVGGAGLQSGFRGALASFGLQVAGGGIDFSNASSTPGGPTTSEDFESDLVQTDVQGTTVSLEDVRKGNIALQQAEPVREAAAFEELVGAQIPDELPTGFNVMIVDHTGKISGTPGNILIINPKELGLPFGGTGLGEVTDIGNTPTLAGDLETVVNDAIAGGAGAQESQDFNILQAIFPQGLGDITLQAPVFIDSPDITREEARAGGTDTLPGARNLPEGIGATTSTTPGAPTEILAGAAIAPRAFNIFQGNTLLEWASLAAQRNGVPLSVLYGLIDHESNWNPNAVGDNGSSFGLAQIHQPAWPGIPQASSFHPVFALNWTAEKLRQRFNQYGSWEAAVAAHNSPVAAAHLVKTGEFQDAKSANYVTDVLSRANRSGLGNSTFDVGEFGPDVSAAAREFDPFQTPDPAQSREFVEATYADLLGRKPTEDEYVTGVKRIASLAREAYSSNVRIGSGSEATAVDPGAQFSQEIKGTGEFAFVEDTEQTDDFTDFAAGVARLLQQGV